MKKVAVIKSSKRRMSNSSLLADKFADGARSAGNDVTVLDLAELNIGFCLGCLACQKGNHVCVLKDDAEKVNGAISVADVVVLATPVYFYNVSAMLKNALDRTNPLYDVKKCFDVYVITSSADYDSATEKVVNAIKGWTECFDGVEIKGVVGGTGLENPADALKDATLMNTAFEMGQNV